MLISELSSNWDMLSSVGLEISKMLFTTLSVFNHLSIHQNTWQTALTSFWFKLEKRLLKLMTKNSRPSKVPSKPISLKKTSSFHTSPADSGERLPLTSTISIDNSNKYQL